MLYTCYILFGTHNATWLATETLANSRKTKIHGPEFECSFASGCETKNCFDGIKSSTISKENVDSRILLIKRSEAPDLIINFLLYLKNPIRIVDGNERIFYELDGRGRFSNIIFEVCY